MMPSWPQPRTRTAWLGLGALLAALYFAAAQVGLLFAPEGSVASPVWPPAGIAVAAVAFWGWRLLPVVFLSAAAVEASAGVPLSWGLLMAAGNTIEAAMAGLFLRRAAALDDPRHVGRLGLAAGAGSLVAGTTGSLALFGSGAITAADWPRAWLTWTLGDLVGIVVLAPALLLVLPALMRAARTRRGLRGRPRARLEPVLAAASVVAVATLVFWTLQASLAFVVLPLLAWLALRTRPATVAGVVLVLDLLAITGTLRGFGPFASAGPQDALLLVQAFVLTATLSALAIAARSTQRRSLDKDLARAAARRTQELEVLNRRLAVEVASRSQAQQRAEQAEHIAGIGSWQWDIVQNRVTWTPALHAIFGTAPTSRPDYGTYLGAIHPDDRDRVQATIARALEDGKDFEFDHRIVRPDGGERHLHCQGRVAKDPAGKPVRMVGVSQDVTERLATQRALEDSLQRLRALSDASPIGIVHTTPEGHVDYANAAWRRITGIVDPGDDHEVERALAGNDPAILRAQWDACMRAGREYQAELQWRHPDGTVHLSMSRAVPTLGPDGKVTGFVSTVEDITDRHAAEQARLREKEQELEVRRLREQAEFKTNFLRTAAHELGTPLTPIKIQLRVLRGLVEGRGGDGERKAVGILERNVERLQMLVRDLLDSARMQSSRLQLHPRPMDLASTVHDVVETFQEAAIARGIALDAEVPPHVGMEADPDRLSQVLYNLLSNAMKFTHSGGRVKVHVAADDGEVRLRVHDDGAGFSPKQASALFQPFTQLHDALSVKAGSGLGLYICKGIVEQHGGHIAAESAGPGQGATFTVVLPRTVAPASAAPTAADAARGEQETARPAAGPHFPDPVVGAAAARSPRPPGGTVP